MPQSTMSQSLGPQRSVQLKNSIKQLAKTNKRAKVESLIEELYGFKVTKAQYEKILKDCGVRKNISDKDWKVLVRKLKSRERKGRESAVYRGGQLMSKIEVGKEISRHSMTFMEELQLASVPSPKTPHGFEVYTPQGQPAFRSLFMNLPILKFQNPPFFGPIPEIINGITSPVLAGQLLKETAKNSAIIPTVESLLPNSAFLDEESATLLVLRKPEDLNGPVLLNMVLYVTSNNFPGEFSPAKIYKFIRDAGNTDLLDELLSRSGLMAEAAVEKLFQCAVEAGDVPVVKHFLDAKLDPNGHKCSFRNIPEKLSPMQLACITRNVAMVRELIRAGAQIDELGAGWKSSALVLAISGAYYLELPDQVPREDWYRYDDDEEDINDVDGFVLGAYYEARARRRQEKHTRNGQRVVRNLLNLISILLDAGSDVNPPGPLSSPVSSDNGTDAQYERDFESLIQAGDSPLTAAAKFRQNAVVSLLIENGADVGFITHHGNSAIQECLHIRGWGHSRSFEVDGWFDTVFAVVQTLLEAKADPNNTAKSSTSFGAGKSPLDLALLRHGIDVVKLLLSAGATVSQDLLKAAVNSKNKTLFGLLSGTGIQADETTVQHIIANLRSKDDWPAPIESLLHLHPGLKTREAAVISAIKNSDLKLWEFLVQHGVTETLNLIQCSPNITSAIESSCSTGNIDVLCCILNRSFLCERSIGPSLGCAIYATITSEDQSTAFKLLDLLLAAGADVNARSTNSDLPLLAAVRRRDLSLVERLIQAGADVNAIGSDSGNALLIAVRCNSKLLVEQLLNAGAIWNSRNLCSGCTFDSHTRLGDVLVAAAAGIDGIPTMNLLIERGADLNQPGFIWIEWGIRASFFPEHECKTPLTVAILRRRLDHVDYLILKGAAVNNPPEIILSESPLSAAIRMSNHALVQRLLEAGAHPGHPLALRAAAVRNPELLQNLILRLQERGPISQSANLGGLTLYSAITARDMRTVEMILWSKLADINSLPDQHFELFKALNPHSSVEINTAYERRRRTTRELSSYFTFVQEAVWNNDSSILKLLLKSGANPDAISPSMKHTPLQIAANQGHKQCLDILIEYGADINSPPATHGGETALQCAAQKGYLGIAFKLIESCADVNAAGAETGGTALELAAYEGRIDMVQMLLNAGAKVHGEEGRKQYERALGLASQNGHFALKKSLEEYHG